jgi:hypothetical protein
MADLKSCLPIAQRIANQSRFVDRARHLVAGHGRRSRRGSQIASYSFEFGGIHRQIAHAMSRPLLDLIFRNIDTPKSHSSRRAIGGGMIRRWLFGRRRTEHGG